MTLNIIKQLWNAWNMTLSKRNMFKWWHDDYDVKSSLKSGWKEIFQKGNLYWLGQKVHLGFFHTMLQENPNKLFSQLNICVFSDESSFSLSAYEFFS